MKLLFWVLATMMQNSTKDSVKGRLLVKKNKDHAPIFCDWDGVDMWSNRKPVEFHKYTFYEN